MNRIVSDEKPKGTRILIANAGRNEIHARRFYEKNGFKVAAEPVIDTPWGKQLALVTYRLELK